MTRNEVIKKVQKYFSIEELACQHVVQRDGKGAWDYFDVKILETLVAVREILGLPMQINTWHSGGQYSQRGGRCNLCQLVKDKTDAHKLYVSMHMLFAAFDFITSISAEDARQRIKDNADKLPYPIRMEKGTSWVHIDMKPFVGKDKIYEFNA